jgi:PAS domain S-box-containing protein
MSEPFDGFSADARDAGWDAPPDLSVAIEELLVADEELRTQSEELLGTRALLEAERLRYHELFHQAPIAYVVTDAHGMIRDANRAAATLFRCRPDRLPGKPLAVFAQDASRRRIRHAIARCAEERTPETILLNITNRLARIRRVEATVAGVYDVQGGVREIRWLLADRTRRARRELARKRQGEELERLVAQRTAELEHAQDLKDQLLATVSHEFRTALAAIGGYADLLAMGVRGPLTQIQLGDVSRIQQAHTHLASIVNDLLTFSKLVAGRAEVHIDDVVVGETIRSMCNLVAPHAEAKHISIDAAVANDDALMVRADGERLRQILLNLLGNAVKFTPANGCVRVSAARRDGHVIIAVEDDGPGIPSNKREAIFQPFVQLPGIAHEDGTGLGLAISLTYARAMRGELTVGDRRGGGSRFELRLPQSTRFASEGAET